tara:strand:+ start:2992 stop:3174 length:183 start_codon:yes stop_codon:yes gene_type:complete
MPLYKPGNFKPMFGSTSGATKGTHGLGRSSGQCRNGGCYGTSAGTSPSRNSPSRTTGGRR